MSKFWIAAAAAVSLMAAATGAQATKFLTFEAPASDGSISGSFGNGGVTLSQNFVDTYDFVWPLNGSTSGTISSSFSALSTDVNFTQVTLNGVAFDFLKGGAGKSELRSIDMLATMSGVQHLVVKGTRPSGSNSSTYTGTLSFTPTAAVPEPAVWGLMIMGFGGAGAMLRTRRRTLAA